MNMQMPPGAHMAPQGEGGAIPPEQMHYNMMQQQQMYMMQQQYMYPSGSQPGYNQYQVSINCCVLSLVGGEFCSVDKIQLLRKRCYRISGINTSNTNSTSSICMSNSTKSTTASNSTFSNRHNLRHSKRVILRRQPLIPLNHPRIQVTKVAPPLLRLRRIQPQRGKTPGVM